MRLKRIYHPYTNWEDYKNGMYKNVAAEDCLVLIEKAKSLLADPSALHEAMNDVTNLWLVSTEENLTNLECNRRAWLGQAACCYAGEVPENLTRAAWGELTEPQQIRANAVATKIIKEWEIRQLNKQTNYAQATFEF